MWLSLDYDFLSLKNDVNVPSKRGMDPQIRIRTKISWIRNTRKKERRRIIRTKTCGWLGMMPWTSCLDILKGGQVPGSAACQSASHSSSVPVREIENQCCGSITFWCGSGSADPCLWLMDPPDPDTFIFIIDLKDVKKNNFFLKFSCILLSEGTFTSFFKDTKSKRSHKTVEIKVFLTILA